MPLDVFKTSQPLTMGVELELQLVSLSDYDLVPACADMLDLLSRAHGAGKIMPELRRSMIRMDSSVHAGYANLLVELRQNRDTLLRTGDRLNVGVCGGGTHPFQQRACGKPPAPPDTVFGQHIHIGCDSGEQALYLLHALNRYIPHFIALSASSPFVQGQDTQFNSARMNAGFAFPLAGRAPFLLDWESFGRDYYARMESTGIVRGMKDLHWDLRPRPEYGAIELRVCDTPLFVERAAALAAYLQALCRHLLEDGEPAPREDDYLVYNYNRFQACRFGLDGTLVHPRTHETLSLREDILTTLRRLEPHARILGSPGALDHLYRVTHTGSDAHHLRGVFAACGSVDAVVTAALERFRQGEAV
jgi:carboxylate-amine ligase